MNDVKLECVSEEKDLGVIVSDDLKSEKHTLQLHPGARQINHRWFDKKHFMMYADGNGLKIQSSVCPLCYVSSVLGFSGHAI